MRLLLVRHAEPDYAIDGLTPKGKAEAARLAERMAKLGNADCYVSPRGRAIATAEPSLRKMGKNAEMLPWLEEFRGRIADPDTGRGHVCWDLKPEYWQSRPKMWNVDTWAEDDLYIGSNAKEVWQETKDGVDELLGRYGYRKSGAVWLAEHNEKNTVICFCHFGIAMAILGYLTNVSPVVLWHSFIMAPSSVTEILTEEREPGKVAWRCAMLGDLSHLENSGEPWSTAGMFPETYTGVDSTDPKKNLTLM